MNAPQVILVPRPELELTDVFVVRRDPYGDRQAFVLGPDDGGGWPATGWHPVAPGAEAYRLARLTSWSGGVSLFDLDAALEPVRAYLRADA